MPRETDELFPGLKTAAKSEAEPAHPSSAPVATEVQAFVPNLTPVAHVDPVRPKAIAEDVRPEVELLVTVDPAGSVVKAEVLAGPEALRRPAIDAVLQWKFHPVIRNGAPVFAHTQATVDFTYFRKPFKPVTADMAGTMEALKRTQQALEERFPRTRQQELADLEQDSNGGTGEDRSFVLPQLAKAALKADSLDKASDYANQLLRTPSTDANYGQAVHDGNMVLGLIALRNDDVRAAKRHLLESAKIKGSPTLSSFGPNMGLAKALLEKGERDAVLEYFEACRSFWSMGAAQLDAWSATVRSGRMPSFGAESRLLIDTLLLRLPPAQNLTSYFSNCAASFPLDVRHTSTIRCCRFQRDNFALRNGIRVAPLYAEHASQPRASWCVSVSLRPANRSENQPAWATNRKQPIRRCNWRPEFHRSNWSLPAEGRRRRLRKNRAAAAESGFGSRCSSGSARPDRRTGWFSFS